MSDAQTSDPKEALERLTQAARPHPADSPRTTVAVYPADLSWIIAEREGLEREVGSVRDLNNILSEKLERRTLTLAAAEAKLSALEEGLLAAEYVLERGGLTDGLALVRQTLALALLHADGQSLNGLAMDGSSPQNDEAHHPADNNHKADCTTSGGAG